MKWYSRISLGLSLAVASAFLVAYWRSLDSHGYPNMNAPGLFAYLLVFPACALLLHSTALAFVLQQRKLGALAKSAAMGDQPGAVDGAALLCPCQRLPDVLPLNPQSDKP